MAKKRSFLGFLASLFILFFSANAFAEGYVCNDIKKYTACNAGYYMKGGQVVGNSCEKCPAGYPNSAEGNNTDITACYSNTKQRAWSGTKNECSGPDNSYSHTCTDCSGNTCDYVAYANSAGTGDGTIKSGCSSNNSACTKSLNTFTCKSGYYKKDTACLSCPSNSSTSNGNTSASCTCNTGHSIGGTPTGTTTTTTTACTKITYSISYTLNSGTQASSGVPSTYTYGTAVTINGVPTRSGYTFAGWCTDSGLTSCSMTQTISATTTGNKTYYAKWTQCTACSAGTGANCSLSVSNNTCTYATTCKEGYYGLTNSGKNNPSCSKCGSNSTTAANNTATTCNCTSPTPSGYSANGTSTGATTSTSGCTAVTYTISYTLNNGTQASSGVPATYKYGTGATVNGVPTRSGYIFAGWCTDSGLTSCSMTQTISATTTGNKTYYAKWTQCTACAAGTGANCSLSVVNNICTYTTTCKGSYHNLQNSGKYNPSCSSCAKGTYTTNGNTATACSPCTNTIPANSEYSGNASSNACPWDCNSGWHKTGTTCTADCSESRNCSLDFSGYTGTYNQCTSNQNTQCTKSCSGNDTSACPANADCTYNSNYKYNYPNSGACPVTGFTCKVNHYKNGSGCTGCDTGYTAPAGATAASSCTQSCTVKCSTNDTANCPANASCTYDTNTSNTGTRNQTQAAGVCSASAPKCAVKTISCNDGYYKNSSGGCDKLPTGGIKCADGSEGLCCAAGYTKSGNTCVANKYNVTYNCVTTCGTQQCGSGTAPTADQATYKLTYTPKDNTCTAPTGYVFVGWTISGTSTVVTPGASFIWEYQEAKTFTAKYSADTCPANQYKNGTVCTACPTSHPNSIAGDNVGINKCYKTCTNNCTSPSCPANSSSCTHDTTKTWSGKQYHNTSTCVIDSGQTAECPIKTLACNSRYYTNGSVCSACSSLGDGSYTMSLTSNNSNANGCYSSCYINCTQKTCPSHATCTHGTERSNGGKFYPSTECKPIGATVSCSINVTPDTGYTCTETACTPIIAPITLNPNNTDSGASAAVTIYQKYGTGWYSNSGATTTLTKAAIPTRPTWTFNGYFTEQSGGTRIIAADGTLPVNTTYSTATPVTLYAQWTRNTTGCQSGKYYNGTSHVDCPAGKYCPGTGSTPIGTAGCGLDCPPDAAGGTVSSDEKSSAITACRTVRTNQNLSDNSGKGNQTCGYNPQKQPTPDYSASCTINITSCNAGYYRQAENSTTCSSTDIGEYSPAGDLNKYACSDLTGAATGVATANKNSIAATLCYNPCSNIAITNGTRVPVNAQEFYNGTKIPECSYTTSCNTGYKASGTTCVANIYTITLNPNNGNANTTIYLKYADGWYSNSNATTKITKVTPPTKGDGMTFEGYATSSNDVVVNSDGTLTTNYTIFSANTTITAQYGNRTAIHCDKGKYYTGTGNTCTTCTAGNYCPGVDTFIGVGTPRGINTCESLGGKYTHAEDAAAATVVSSAAGAQAATDCYATNVVYTSQSNKATGSQTCYYNPSTTYYTEGCTTIKVLSCIGGNYLANSTDTDCTAVGTGYYSPAKALTKTACPNLGTVSGVTTKDTQSEKVTECYLGNIWYTPTGGHSGHRRSCYHTDNASDTNVTTGYSYNCDVSVIVTCDAGYYDDGAYKNSNNERDCKAVTDKEKYSPAQSYFTSESAQPNQDAPGSSTQLHDCPSTKTISNGTAKRVFNSTWTASDYGVCEYKSATCDTGYRAITSGTIAKCVWDDPNACPEGCYCPDGGEEPIECPRDKNGREGTTEIGAKKAEDCFIEYDPYSNFQKGTGSAICNYNSSTKDYTRCDTITAKTCNDGYYYRDAGSATCVQVTSGNYSPAPAITQTPCPAGGNGSNEFAASYAACYKNCEITVAHSATVAAKDEKVFGTSANSYAACSFNVTCQTGYSPNNNNTANPTCDANRYTVTLDKDGGSGNVAASIQCTFNSGSCTLPATTGLTRAGYTVGTKWCTAKNGAGTCYTAGSNVTTNISANGTATTLYAVWTPNVYKITLKHTDATVAAAPATVYLKYATGWFLDSDATKALTSLTTKPEKTGYEFSGYKAANNTVIVNASGTFQTTEAALTFTAAPADINVVWSAGNTQCPAGKYYQGTGATCLPCQDNHFCPGGSYATDSGEAGMTPCRDNGKTAAGASASSETQCFKENLPTYVATHGTGTQTCYFDETEMKYSAPCKDKVITACADGYWLQNRAAGQDEPDCVAVGQGYYSITPSLDRAQCPNGGTTTETTAATIQRCFKSGLDYAAEFGTGTQRCYYSSGDGTNAIYNRDCDTKEITKCRGGYWLNEAVATDDCSPVGQNYFSETDDTKRHECKDGGKTNSDITSTPSSCYKDSEVYTAKHGGGYRTCYYSVESGIYEFSCKTPTMEYCHGGYYSDVNVDQDDCIEVGYGFWSPAATATSQNKAPSLLRTSCAAGETTETTTSTSASACYTCPAGMICDPDSPNKPETCSTATKGTHPNSDAGNTSIAGCWRDCALATNASTMKGHDYYGQPSTCAIDHCKAGYTNNKNVCELCPAGTFCGGGDDNCPAGQNCGTPKTCASLGDGEWKYSDIGASSPADCYRKCEILNLDGGKGIPTNDREYYDTMCQYRGVDAEGNPCDIEGNKCITRACKPSYEMINGTCAPCNRDHALSYKSGGNCMVESCEAGWHPYAQQCEQDISECDAPHALRAEKQWDYKKNAYGICMVKECEDGYHVSSNACVADVQECMVEHGIGEKEWNHTTNTWGECVATSCDPGFTNDPYETSEPTKQCGHCKNKFGIKGELAASGYSRGCTISACMYQGELYNLENNECNPICDVNGYEDETGTMKWNPSTHKCERKCKTGYVMW